MNHLRSAQATGRGTKQERNSADLGASGESVVREFVRRSGAKLTNFAGMRLISFEALLIAVALSVYAIFRLLNASAGLLDVFLFTLVDGNVTVMLLSLARPLFTQPFPRNWAIYLALLLPIGAIGSTAASSLLYLLKPPQHGVAEWFISNMTMGTLLSTIVGISMYVVALTRIHLEAEKRELQTQVLQGLQKVESQQSEIQAAFEIQRNLLPKTIGQIAGVQIACAWQPARTVSGDYYDVVVLSETRIGICLADVSGKGVAAALLMANLQAAFRAFVAKDPDPGAVCRQLNQVLSENVGSNKFVSFIYGVIDRERMIFTYENAGHVPPLLLRESSATDLTDGGTVLGLFPAARYESRTIPINPGDCLLLATDGVTEAANADDVEFGGERIALAARRAYAGGAHAIRAAIFEEVTAFCNSNFFDDATLMAVIIES